MGQKGNKFKGPFQGAQPLNSSNLRESESESEKKGGRDKQKHRERHGEEEKQRKGGERM